MYPRFLYPLLPYRSFLDPFLGLCAIVVPCWVLFRLYRRRMAGSRASLKRESLLLVSVVYLSGLAAATLTPNDSSRLREQGVGGIEIQPRLASLTCSSPTLPKGTDAQAFCVHNARGNLMLFFPLGILIPLVWAHLGFWQGLQIGFVLSLSIEVVQYLSSAWGSYRAADVNDIILNVLGAALGLMVTFLLRFLLRPAAGRTP